MRMTALIGLAGLAVTSTASLAASAAPVPATYLLSMQWRDGDRLVGSPKIAIAAGVPSRVEIGDAAGNHYAMTVTATAQTAGTVAIRSTIDVVSAGARSKASPAMLVAVDKPSAIAFGTESPMAKPFRVDFTINKLS